MELHHHDTAGIFYSHHGVGQPLCRKGLADTGGTLQNNILLIFKQANQGLIISSAHIYFIQKVFGCVNRVLDFYFLNFLILIIFE